MVRCIPRENVKTQFQPIIVNVYTYSWYFISSIMIVKYQSTIIAIFTLSYRCAYTCTWIDRARAMLLIVKAIWATFSATWAIEGLSFVGPSKEYFLELRNRLFDFIGTTTRNFPGRFRETSRNACTFVHDEINNINDRSRSNNVANKGIIV